MFWGIYKDKICYTTQQNSFYTASRLAYRLIYFFNILLTSSDEDGILNHVELMFIFHHVQSNGMLQLDHAPSYSCVTVRFQSTLRAHCTRKAEWILRPIILVVGSSLPSNIKYIHTENTVKSILIPTFCLFSNCSHFSFFSSGLFRTLWPRKRSEFTHYDLVIGT